VGNGPKALPARERGRVTGLSPQGAGKHDEPQGRQRAAIRPRTAMRSKPSRWRETTRTERDLTTGTVGPKKGWQRSFGSGRIEAMSVEGRAGVGPRESQERRPAQVGSVLSRALKRRRRRKGPDARFIECRGGIRTHLAGQPGDGPRPWRRRERPTTRYGSCQWEGQFSYENQSPSDPEGPTQPHESGDYRKAVDSSERTL